MVPEFTLKDLPQKETLGEKLSRRRKNLKLEFADVEHETKIRAKYLKALEENNWDKLPSDVYTRGFLKKYCQFLNLDYNEVVEDYKRAIGIETNIQKASGKYKEFSPKAPRFVITPKTLIILGIFSGIFLVVTYLGWQFKSFVAPPKLEVSSPYDNVTTESDFIDISGKTDPGALLFVNDTPLETDPSGSFQGKVALKPGSNTLKISAKNHLEKTTEIVRNILVTPKISEIPATPQPAVGVNLQVRTKEAASWMKVEADGKEIFQGIILADVLKVFSGKEKVKITAGNPGVVWITLSNEKTTNKDLGLLSKLGEAARGIEFLKGIAY